MPSQVQARRPCDGAQVAEPWRTVEDQDRLPSWGSALAHSVAGGETVFLPTEVISFIPPKTREVQK